MHQQAWERIAVEHHHEDPLHRLDFEVFVALLQRVAQRLQVGRLLGRVVLVDNCPACRGGRGAHFETRLAGTERRQTSAAVNTLALEFHGGLATHFTSGK
jgi:hypothetical protein